jgi:hypothetical protein
MRPAVNKVPARRLRHHQWGLEYYFLKR